jgi:hypothetical protein
MENVCFEAAPYYTCIESQNGKADVVFEGKGRCTNVWRSSGWGGGGGTNAKKEEKYPEQLCF